MRWAFLTAALGLAACGDADSAASAGAGGGIIGSTGAGTTLAGGAQPPAADVLGPAFARLEFEVDYAPGAEPFVGATLSQGDAWSIFERNARALYGDAKTLVVPRTLGEMSRVEGLPPGPYDAKALLAIADAHRDVANTGDAASVYVIFVDGTYRDEAGERPEVVGLSLGASGVIAMFKPVVAAAGGVLPDTGTLLEQAVLVHELGHASGLVDNGIAMASPHLDAEHGKHCSNTSCVMYYAVESGDDPLGFAVALLGSGADVLFGPECLADAERARAQ